MISRITSLLIVLIAAPARAQDATRTLDRDNYTTSEYQAILNLCRTYTHRPASDVEELKLRWLEARSLDANGRAIPDADFFKQTVGVDPIAVRRPCDLVEVAGGSPAIIPYQGTAAVYAVSDGGSLVGSTFRVLPDVHQVVTDTETSAPMACRRFSVEFHRTLGEQKLRCQVVAFVHDATATSPELIEWPFPSTKQEQRSLFGGYLRQNITTVPWPRDPAPLWDAGHWEALVNSPLLGKIGALSWSRIAMLQKIFPGDPQLATASLSMRTQGLLSDPPVVLYLFYRSGDRALISSWDIYQLDWYRTLETK